MKKLYLLRTIKTFRLGFYCFAVFAFAISTVFLSACTEEEGMPIVEAGPAVLSASTTELVLLQENGNDAAFNLSWTPASNHGTNAAIDYSLEIDKKGNDFASPKVLVLERTLYSHSFEGYEINNIARKDFGIAAGTTGELVFRIKATPTTTALAPEYSQVVELAITPYKPVTPTLYLIGDATPNGWSADAATPLQVSPDDSTVFSVDVQLKPGNYKFITTLGQFLPSYNKGASDNALVYRSEDAQPDDQFVATEAGLYSMTVNLADLTISMEALEGPPYTQLWAVGSAVPKGWDLDNADEMVQSEADPFVFTYSAVLKAGEFKIATAKDWGAPFYRPTIADAPITHTAVQLSAGDPDNKWKISETGYYKVTLDLRNKTIAFNSVDLYLIGDAGPNGWNIATPEPMANNGEGRYTYTGPLTPGELKISKFQGDWCGGDWINSATPDQAITDVAYINTFGCNGPDNKWRITDATAGDYIITVDLPDGTITIERQ